EIVDQMVGEIGASPEPIEQEPDEPEPPAHSNPSDDTDILELPGIVAVEVLCEQPLAVFEGCPIAKNSNDLTEVGAGDGENTLEIDLLGLDDALPRMLQRPYDPGQHRRGDLERGGVVVWRRAPRLGNRQA